MNLRFCLVAVSAITALPANADPLKEFEAIVARCKQNIGVAAVEVRNLTSIGKWAKVAIRPEGPVEYDVKKTDSLVSPYIASISFTTLSVAERAENEADAQRLEVNFEAGRVSRERTILRFAYQSADWVPQDGSQTYEFRRSTGEPFQPPTTVRLPKEDYMKQFRVSERCLRKQ